MSVFHFKQFSVRQDNCAMKISTDAVLLGSWASLNDKKLILDIGTGTGVLALMAAQRNPAAEIMAVELEENAYLQTKENFQNSPWSDRLSVNHCAIQHFKSDNIFDCIISNPPYYPEDRFLSADRLSRRISRSDKGLNFEDLIESVLRFLDPEKGDFFVILPVEVQSKFVELAANQGLYLNHEMAVISKEGKEPYRVLMGFSMKKTPMEESELIISKGTLNNDYSEEYQNLLRDFLIIF
jgi:tRNA1Val (adenine37-N6)-methyltransferase